MKTFLKIRPDKSVFRHRRVLFGTTAKRLEIEKIHNKHVLSYFFQVAVSLPDLNKLHIRPYVSLSETQTLRNLKFSVVVFCVGPGQTHKLLFETPGIFTIRLRNVRPVVMQHKLYAEY